jgi:hypothetical protein
MTWFKIDDSFWRCRKVRKLGKDPVVVQARVAGMGVWTYCGDWSADNLTDGFVPWEIVEEVDPDRQLAKRLIASDLWLESIHDDEQGIQFHDWADWQPTRDQVTQRRRSDAERKARWRETRWKESQGNPDTSEKVPPAESRRDTTRDTTRDTGRDSDSDSHVRIPDQPTSSNDTDSPPEMSRRDSRRESREESALPDPTRPDPTRSTSSGPVGRTTTGDKRVRKLGSLPQSGRAYGLVAKYAKECTGIVPTDVKAELGPVVDGLILDGLTDSDIAESLVEWGKRGLPASVLPSIAHGVLNGSRAGRTGAAPAGKPAVDPADPMTWGDDRLSRVLGFEPQPTIPSELMADGVPKSARDAWLRENVSAWRHGRRLEAKAKLAAKATG